MEFREMLGGSGIVRQSRFMDDCTQEYPSKAPGAPERKTKLKMEQDL
jgi:hypothetical protein